MPPPRGGARKQGKPRRVPERLGNGITGKPLLQKQLWGKTMHLLGSNNLRS